MSSQTWDYRLYAAPQRNCPGSSPVHGIGHNLSRDLINFAGCHLKATLLINQGARKMECHAPLGDNTIPLNLGTGRVVKRLRTELHTTKLAEQERATGDVFGCQGIENIDPTELKRRKARERYASMIEEQKARNNAKRRENYHRKKVESRARNMASETFSSYPAYINTWYYSICYNEHFNTLEV